jgi:thioredoxin 1
VTAPQGHRGRRASALVLAAAAIAGLAAVALVACGGGSGSTGTSATATAPPTSGSSSGAAGAQKVTFIELGADKCVPCKEMQPVMKAIEQSFGDQVEVVFYDVWKDPAPADEYGVQMIPTQVFLDENGEEFHRHVGFYPQAEIEALLIERGLSKLTTQ